MNMWFYALESSWGQSHKSPGREYSVIQNLIVVSISCLVFSNC